METKMMKIEEIVGDLILIVLDNHEPLKKIGIDQDKIFVYVNGYDENGIWIHHPKFQVPNVTGKGKSKTKNVELLINAFSKIKTQNIDLIIAGPDFGMLKKLKQLDKPP